MKFKHLLFFLFLFILNTASYSQQLVINEVSQGPSGAKEYVELVVVGTPTCNAVPCMDLRNYIIDDNNGFHATGAGVGIAAGCVRLKNIPFWQCIPYGTIIVFYNDADQNASIPAVDLSMIDGNCKLIIPISDCTLLERHTTLPSTALSTYPNTGFTNCGNWTNISMANGDDSFQTITPAGALHHSVSWGNNTIAPIIYFAGAATGNVALMTNSTNNNPANQLNWVMVPTAGNESPGLPNNALNSAWISSMNNSCLPLIPFTASVTSSNAGCTCNGSATVSAAGAIGPYTYTWFPSGGNASVASGLCAGIYTVSSTSSNGCVQTLTVNITSVGSVSATVANTSVTCNGLSNGSATVTPSGGSSPYTYTWSPSGGNTLIASGLAAGTYTVLVKDANNCTVTAVTTITQPPVLTAALSSSNVSCNGGSNGSATVTAGGGSPGYTYNWLPSGGTASVATGFAAGNYTATVTDSKGCTVTAVANITQPPVLTAALSSSNVSCNGGSNGSATVTAGGGSPGYTYNWLPSGGTASVATGFAVGNYTATVTDSKGCTVTAVANITQPPVLTAALSSSNVSCNGGSNGSATVTAGGGSPGYTYNWLPSGGTASVATGFAAGSYTATVTDSKGCTITAVANITQPPVLTSALSSSNVSCNGGSNGSATVTAGGGSPGYTYNWLPSGGTASVATGFAAGNYTATVTDSKGCTVTAVANITQPPVLTAALSSSNVSCNGGSNGSATVTAGGGSPGYTYNWLPSGGTASVATGFAVGNYTATVTDSKGCTITAVANITQPPVLTAALTSSNVSCNGGSNGSATVTVGGGSPGYTYNWLPSGGTTSVATGFAAGNYTATVTDSKGCTITAVANITQPPVLTAALSSSNVSCNGGSNGNATVTVGGGSPGYTYNWLPSGGTTSVATGFAAGNYTATVTDSKGCTVTAVANITQPPVLTAAISSSNATCGFTNGSATVTAGGGSPGYTYNWLPSGGTASVATNLAAGNYTATITDSKGCTITAVANINQPVSITTTVNVTNVSCNGGSNGSASVSITGGSTPYSYTWSPAPGTGQGTSIASGLSAQIYTITIKDNAGCQTVAIANITQPPVLTILISSNNVSCNGGSNGSATVTAGGGTPGYTYNWLPSGGTASVATGFSIGSYTATLTDNNGCSVTAVANITQPPILTAAISSSNVSCNGGSNGSATVTAGGGSPGYTYNWLPSGGTASVATGFSIGSYTATLTDSKGCTVTAVSNITQPPALTAAISSSNASCGSSNGSATVTAGGGTPSYIYSWTPSGGTASVATGLGAGSYTVAITDSKNCTITALVNIIQPTAPTAVISTSNVSCNGGSDGSTTVTASGGFPGYTYSWTPSGGTASVATGFSAGNYTVEVTDNQGCTIFAVANITQPTALTAAITSSNISCNGGSNGSATITAGGGSPGYTYNWLPSGGTASVASGLALGSYTATVTDSKGCTNTAVANITQPPVLTAAMSSSNISCNGGSNGSASVTVSGGNPGYIYSWIPSGGTASVASGLAVGSYTATITDNKGCTITALANITQPTILTSNATVTNVLCFGNSSGVAFLNTTGGTSPYNYIWSPNVGTTATASNLTQGTYSVLITDANNCFISKIINITQPPAISLSVNALSLCNGQSGTLNGNVSGGVLPYTYFWNNNVGSNTIQINPSASTIYTFNVVDANGCVSPIDTALVNVGSALNLSISPTQSICAGKATVLTASASGGNGNYLYNWMPGNINTPNISVTLSNTAIYTVTLSDGCTTPNVIQTTTIYVETVGASTVIASLYEGCAPLCVTFTNTNINANNISSISWNFSDGGTSQETAPTYCFNKPGIYTAYNSYTTKLGCVGSGTLNGLITVYQKPIAQFQANPNYVTFTKPEVEFTNQSTGATSYFWDFHNLSHSTETNPSYSFSEVGKYLVTLVASDGICQDTAFKIIECKPEFTFFAPNTFTPDNDKLNDIFLPIGEGWDLNKFELTIFDRWGEKLFKTNRWDEGWDGTYKGTIVKDDIYVWKVFVYDIFNIKHEFIGHIEVIK